MYSVMDCGIICLFIFESLAMKFALLHRNWCQNLTFVFPWMYGHISFISRMEFSVSA